MPDFPVQVDAGAEIHQFTAIPVILYPVACDIEAFTGRGRIDA